MIDFCRLGHIFNESLTSYVWIKNIERENIDEWNFVPDFCTKLY